MQICILERCKNLWLDFFPRIAAQQEKIIMYVQMKLMVCPSLAELQFSEEVCVRK